MLVTGEGSHQKDVGLVVAVGEVNALGFFLNLVGPAILGGEGEAGSLITAPLQATSLPSAPISWRPSS